MEMEEGQKPSALQGSATLGYASLLPPVPGWQFMCWDKGGMMTRVTAGDPRGGGGDTRTTPPSEQGARTPKLSGL